jgi:hypothetical protein
MATHGFVYILANEYMPDLYKIGCTERSPHARADELGKGTGVPVGFQVLCYAEFEDFQLAERQMHQWLSHSRVNESREFFHGCLVSSVGMLWWHPSRMAFCDATAGAKNPLYSELLSRVQSEYHKEIDYFSDLQDPFSPIKEMSDSRGFEAFLARSIENKVEVVEVDQNNEEAA